MAVEIAAPPKDVFQAVIDVAEWGRFSPDCSGSEVCGPGPIEVGVKFEGHNHRGSRQWKTHCVVTEYRQDRLFAFRSAAIGLKISTWRYRLEPIDGCGGTRLVHEWHDDRGHAMAVIGRAVSGVSDRATHNRASMEVTLARLKEYYET